RLIPCSTCHLFVSAKKCQPISGRVSLKTKSRMAEPCGFFACAARGQIARAPLRHAGFFLTPPSLRVM
ncbi:hypothetical protein, partial [Burkholderia multivorans]|uniref:hypothetical protein n=1 Tax=Burkholderia multivorans TaxID=87883 RepID=UPI00287066AE